MKSYQPTGNLFTQNSIIEISLSQIGIFYKKTQFHFEIYSPPQFFYQGELLITNQDKLYIMVPFVLSTHSLVKYSCNDKNGFFYISEIVSFVTQCDKQEDPVVTCHRLFEHENNVSSLDEMFERVSYKIIEREADDEHINRSTLLRELMSTSFTESQTEPLFDLQTEISNIQQPL
jgi:hypothetical protein